MNEHIFYLNRDPGVSLQSAIQEMLVSAILDGYFPPGSSLPSCRNLAKTLDVSRNTVVIVYERLLEEGFLVSKQRRGYFVNQEILDQRADTQTDGDDRKQRDTHWQGRFCLQPSDMPTLRKPEQWRLCRYPFIYGQLSNNIFPVAEWRECSRKAATSLLSRGGFIDSGDSDDPLLIDQLRKRLLPKRGIRCAEDEILITLGTQNSLYLLSRLLTDKGVTVGIENPGYQDASTLFSLNSASIKPLQIDSDGLLINEQLDDCDYVFVTPSHQYPTTVTMPLSRRQELLQWASDNDRIIIEDDYENEISYNERPKPSLKSLDQNERVIYVGSLSKTLAPGLRLGYLVGPSRLIKEARALRRLILRHPPINNQRTLALFLAAGYHDALIRKLTKVYRERRQVLIESLEELLPAVSITYSSGGSSLWLEAPEGVDMEALQAEALSHGLFIEPGHPQYFQEQPPKNFFRLGYSAIATDVIREGVGVLAQLLHKQMR